MPHSSYDLPGLRSEELARCSASRAKNADTNNIYFIGENSNNKELSSPNIHNIAAHNHTQNPAAVTGTQPIEVRSASTCLVSHTACHLSPLSRSSPPQARPRARPEGGRRFERCGASRTARFSFRRLATHRRLAGWQLWELTRVAMAESCRCPRCEKVHGRGHVLLPAPGRNAAGLCGQQRSSAVVDDAPTASSAKPAQLSKRKQRSSMRLADFRRRMELRSAQAGDPHFNQRSHLHFGCGFQGNHLGDRVGSPGLTQ